MQTHDRAPSGVTRLSWRRQATRKTSCTRSSASRPTRHNDVLALWQNHIERILAGWVGELAAPIHRGREVTGFAQDDTGVDVELSALL
ncbi:FAD-dependent monooxygenase [Polyangium sp. 15x6]|nr:FAD-dependent monooxygenase [Polyangium sp. 15x6]MDI3288166.1 FAD-dependent monooxygenase [Polyangium sp. 15x6]